MTDDLERRACSPITPTAEGFNPQARIPYGCEVAHIRSAMNEFAEFLGFVNTQLHGRRITRMEVMMMPANFSGLVGEFMVTTIPKYCPTLVKNRYHNGHPDLIPAGQFPGDSVQHSDVGIEVKASRYASGWQGHNPENIWLLVFVFESNRPNDSEKGVDPMPFRFKQVLGAQLNEADWRFSGRATTSRRTITASVARSGYDKMLANWIYSERQ